MKLQELRAGDDMECEDGIWRTIDRFSRHTVAHIYYGKGKGEWIFGYDVHFTDGVKQTMMSADAEVRGRRANGGGQP